MRFFAGSRRVKDNNFWIYVLRLIVFFSLSISLSVPKVRTDNGGQCYDRAPGA